MSSFHFFYWRSRLGLRWRCSVCFAYQSCIKIIYLVYSSDKIFSYFSLSSLIGNGFSCFPTQCSIPCIVYSNMPLTIMFCKSTPPLAWTLSTFSISDLSVALLLWWGAKKRLLSPHLNLKDIYIFSSLWYMSTCKFLSSLRFIFPFSPKCACIRIYIYFLARLLTSSFYFLKILIHIHIYINIMIGICSLFVKQTGGFQQQIHWQRLHLGILQAAAR